MARTARAHLCSQALDVSTWVASDLNGSSDEQPSPRPKRKRTPGFGDYSGLLGLWGLHIPSHASLFGSALFRGALVFGDPFEQA